MKKLLLLFALVFSSTATFSQEQNHSEIFKSEKYQTLTKTIIEAYDNSYLKEESEFYKKLGKDNLIKIVEAKTTVGEWLKNNWKSTNFASLEEAIADYEKLNATSEEVNSSVRKILPIFSEIVKEIGYKAFFEQFSKDISQHLSVLMN